MGTFLGSVGDHIRRISATHHFPKLLLALFLIPPFFSGCSNSPSSAPEVPKLPTIISFTASPETIKVSEKSVLAWSVSNSTHVSIDNGVGDVEATGNREVSPSETTTYTLKATNSAGDISNTCKVTVEQDDTTVYITNTGTKYHKANCRYLDQSKKALSLSQACAQGYTPCSVCKPQACK
jgi:hypothetical protein